MTVEIDNPHLLGTVCGPDDDNLREISNLLSAPVHTRGNTIVLNSSDIQSGILFGNLLEQMKEIAQVEHTITRTHVRSLFDALESDYENGIRGHGAVIAIKGARKTVYPGNNLQKEYIKAMSAHELIFSVGPAGTGKTYLAVAHALKELASRKKRKIILTRPVIETGENLGFLPGDLTLKLAPYLRPLQDAMEDLMEPDFLNRLRESGRIELAPLAYMRGRSLKDCCIVLDEAQNTTKEQMKMFLTRLGEGSRAIVTGDLTQSDLPRPEHSGLQESMNILKNLEEISFIKFRSIHVVRHPLVKKIVNAYEQNV